MTFVPLLPAEIFSEVIKHYTPVPLQVFEAERGSLLGQPAQWNQRSMAVNELRNLRLVSRLFNDFASALLFSDVTLNFYGAGSDYKDCLRCCDVIEALAIGRTGVFMYTRRLSVSTTRLFRPPFTGPNRPAPPPVNEVVVAQKLVKNKLAQAIVSFKGVELVSYGHASATDPQQLANDIVWSLGTLPLFRHFRLELDYPAGHFTLRSISHLQSFEVIWKQPGSDELLAAEVSSLLSRSPELSELSLYSRGFQGGRGNNVGTEIFTRLDDKISPLPLKRLSFDGIRMTPALVSFSLRHLTNLELLEVEHALRGKDSITVGHVCNLLKRNGIHLTAITTDMNHMTHDAILLDYLASNPGFRSIRFLVHHDMPHQVCEYLLQILYRQILPVQRKTLEELHVGVIKTHHFLNDPLDVQLGEIKGCGKLWKLAMCRALTREEFEHHDTSIVEHCFEVFLKLPLLKDVTLFLDSSVMGSDMSMKEERAWWKLAIPRLRILLGADPDAKTTSSCATTRGVCLRISSAIIWTVSPGLKRNSDEALITPHSSSSKIMKSSVSESDYAASVSSNASKTTGTIKPSSAFSKQALPLHINLTHTPPRMPDVDEVVVPDDPGHIGTLTLVPCTLPSGGYGWKGQRTVEVELLDVERGEERKQVEVLLSVEAVVADSRGPKTAAPVSDHPVSEFDGGTEGYESDNEAANATGSSL
ncbi:hypothetical protein NP233_g4609 [Leucocoprinus birnbaumii]|uniref:Uncharacterized protein n=1 Tax=Leucocoprinus birnbaumii TaxID=56174 RepID=A0AAD5VUZ1_9AGAR|nr:hypothetical protein NP233_g4609 [Leucocoprinus birnbaumii]